MLKLKQFEKIAFCYNGKQADLSAQVEKIMEEEGSLTTVYRIADGLHITNRARKIEKFGAYEWVNEIESTRATESKIISELWDGVLSLDIGHEERYVPRGGAAAIEEGTMVYAPNGSVCRYFEFYTEREREVYAHVRQRHLHMGDTREYTASGGRSSEEQAPFFEVRYGNKGVIFAVGWTGQWKCSITRNEDSVTIKTKIEDTHFKVLPGEKFRTSSILVMPYEGTREAAHAKWRRLLKEHFSLMGGEGNRKYAPLSLLVWGGSTSESVLSDIAFIKKNKLPFEYLWMDAGWYGIDTRPNKSAFVDEWKKHTGDWRVSHHIHPGGLLDVLAAAEDSKMKFLLWFEIERVNRGTPIAREHPEYMLDSGDTSKDLLLNLGNEAAWQYCFDTVVQKIEALSIGCFRLDFNMSPLPYWRAADAEDRRGISEIRYIDGLYRLFDALLAHFPDLIIDNCASGGRRIDIEMIRRSVPLWRSDFQCAKKCDVSANQTHHQTYNTWVPYSGSCGGDSLDEYRLRSSYDSSLALSRGILDAGDAGEVCVFLTKYLNEYKRLRPYFSEDFYPLTKASEELDVWSAMQFHRPAEGDGIVQIFRREEAPYDSATFKLFGLDKDKNYAFEDMDGGDPLVMRGDALLGEGFFVTVKEKRKAKVYLYREIP